MGLRPVQWFSHGAAPYGSEKVLALTNEVNKNNIATLVFLAYNGTMTNFPKAPALAGARIRIARQALGMTQEELARAVGVSRSAVAQWETDRAGQVRGNLSKVAAILRVSLAYLVDGDVELGADGAAEGSVERALLRLYRACSDDDRAFLVRTAKRLARESEQTSQELSKNSTEPMPD